MPDPVLLEVGSMMAVTLAQPYAALVACGVSVVVNRSSSLGRRRELGDVVAIHASVARLRGEIEAIARIAPELQPDIAEGRPGLRGWRRWSLMVGVVVGVARIERVVNDYDARYEKSSTIEDPSQRRWYGGPFGYVVRDARRLERAVPCRSGRGLWRLPDDVEAAVSAQLAAASAADAP